MTLQAPKYSLDTLTIVRKFIIEEKIENETDKSIITDFLAKTLEEIGSSPSDEALQTALASKLNKLTEIVNKRYELKTQEEKNAKVKEITGKPKEILQKPLYSLNTIQQVNKI